MQNGKHLRFEGIKEQILGFLNSLFLWMGSFLVQVKTVLYLGSEGCTIVMASKTNHLNYVINISTKLLSCQYTYANIMWSIKR